MNKWNNQKEQSIKVNSGSYTSDKNKGYQNDLSVNTVK